MASTSNEAVAGVVNNARLHEDLLLQLSELDYAGEALKQAEERLADLEKSLPEQRRTLEKSARSSRKEFADWERVSHSIVTRAGARIKGAVGRAPLEARIEKEEQEWLDALREESAAKNALITTENEIKEMQDMIQDLKERVQEHQAIQTRIDQLLESVFAGPSHAFPEEDHAESEVYAIEKEYKDAQTRMNNLAQALNLLAKANNDLKQAQRHLGQAIESAWTPLLLRDRYSDALERESMIEALNSLNRVKTHYISAQSYDHAVSALVLPDLQSLAGQYLTGRLGYSSLSMRDVLSVQGDNARVALRRASATIQSQVRDTQQRHKSAEAVSKNAHLRLRRARLQLDSTRRQIMIDVSRNGIGRQTVLTEEPETMADGEGGADRPEIRSNNPYADFLASRASTLDRPIDEPLPAYQPRSRAYENLQV